MRYFALTAAVMVSACNNQPDPFEPANNLVASDCWFDQSQVSHATECYELQIPQDYSEPNGKRIAMAVVRVPAQKPKDLSPIVHLGGGGPGASMSFEDVDSFNYWLSAYDDFSINKGRDLYMIDPRGVGASSPSLNCPAMMDVTLAYLAGDVEHGQLIQQLEATAGVCVDDLQAQGIDFNQYNSPVVVEDIERLRQAINEPMLTLYGISYAAVYAKEYAENYPEFTEALILDSPAFLGGDSYQSMEDGIEQLEENLANYCDHFESCSSYDALAMLSKSYQQLQTVPQSYTVDHPYQDGSVTIEWTGDKWLQFIFQASYLPDLYFDLPTWQHAIEQQNSLADITNIAALMQLSPDNSSLVYLSHLCAEEIPFSRPQELFEARNLPWQDALYFADLSQACDVLGVQAVPREHVVQQAVMQPTLILQGTLDTATPEDNTNLHLQYFPRHEMETYVWTHGIVDGDESIGKVINGFLRRAPNM